MEGLKQIIDRIISDAEQEANAVLEKSQRDADALLNSYHHQAETVKTMRLDASRANAALLLERALSKAELDARKALLATKQALIEDVFSDAEKHLLHLPTEAYRAFLIQLAIKGSRSGNETLLLNAHDRSEFGEAVVAGANETLMAEGRVAGLTLSEQVRPIQGGLILKDGPVETVSSIEALLQEAKRTQVAEIARILFNA